MGTTTTNEVQFPSNETVTHDLDPTNGDGDLVRHVSVAYAQSLVIAAESTDDNSWSASVRWIDSEGDDNLFQEETATDIELSSVTQDWARLVRKGPIAEVTFTSDVAGGTQNQINAFLDTHR